MSQSGILRLEKRRVSNLAENAIHNPVHRSCAYAVAVANGFALQVFNYKFYKRQLHVFWVFNINLFASALRVKFYRVVCEYGKTKFTFVPDNLNAVLFC